jgi:hypothetical protein
MSEVAVRRTWSPSTLKDFERCKLYYKLKRLDKVAEPARELKPGQTEAPNSRGDRIHKLGEDFVKTPEPMKLPCRLTCGSFSASS